MDLHINRMLATAYLTHTNTDPETHKKNTRLSTNTPSHPPRDEISARTKAKGTYLHGPLVDATSWMDVARSCRDYSASGAPKNLPSSMTDRGLRCRSGCGVSRTKEQAYPIVAW